MSLKLKLNSRPSIDNAGSPGDGIPPTPSSAVSTGPPKLKLSVSQPPTPINEGGPSASPAAKKRAAPKPSIKASAAGKKRGANDDISPAAKRSAKVPSLARRLSLKPPPIRTASDSILTGPVNRIKLGSAQRKPSIPKLASLTVKRPPPPREPGVGYDSEDSEAEEDPAIQQAFVLRMRPGEDCDYLRDAIANGKIGAAAADGGAQVSIRFLDSQCRRAVITIRGRKYGAALVDLPCVVETMKSWDKKGWWKVSDACQMLLVLGRCNGDDEARNLELPREVDANSMQFAHGLTPPMHWVRKRRFRKRPSYKDMANVEEEVERLLREDDEATKRGGQVSSEVLDRAEAERERSQSHFDDDADADAEGEAVETVEHDDDAADYGHDDDEGAADLEDDLQAMFDLQDNDEAAPPSATAIAQSPGPLADMAASATAIDLAMGNGSAAGTPVGTPGVEMDQGWDEDASQMEEDEDEEEDDDDDDDEEDDEADSPDVIDEDALARAAERNQQLEEVADLEREVDKQRAKAAGMKNQLLKEKALAQLLTLEEELRTKRTVFGLDADD